MFVHVLNELFNSKEGAEMRSDMWAAEQVLLSVGNDKESKELTTARDGWLFLSMDSKVQPKDLSILLDALTNAAAALTKIKDVSMLPESAKAELDKNAKRMRINLEGYSDLIDSGLSKEQAIARLCESAPTTPVKLAAKLEDAKKGISNVQIAGYLNTLQR